MSDCHRLEDYLTGFLEGPDLAEFEAHLERCQACGERVASTREADEHLRDWLNAVSAPDPSEAGADRLVDAARNVESSGTSLRILVPLAIAAGVAVVLAVYVFGRGEVEENGTAPDKGAATVADRLEPRVVESDRGRVASAESEHGEILSVDGEGRLLVELASDRIGLGGHSRLEVVRSGRGGSLVEVHRGEVGFDVEPRRGDGSFEVAARGYRVVVVGTRFRVAAARERGIEVGVVEGVVAVIEPGGARREVSAGRTYSSDGEGAEGDLGELDEGSRAAIDALLDESADPRSDASEPPSERVDGEDTGRGRPTSAAETTSPRSGGREPGEPARVFDRDSARKLILEGRYAEAERLLEDHLASAPGDGASWMLLADCRRKAQNWRGAVDAYQQVVGTASPRVANRARFRAATVLQDRLGRYQDAARLLDEYLSAGASAKPLQSEAMLRLARARLALGQRQRAEKLLDQILEHHAGTSAAVQARQLLSTLRGE